MNQLYSLSRLVAVCAFVVLMSIIVACGSSEPSATTQANAVKEIETWRFSDFSMPILLGSVLFVFLVIQTKKKSTAEPMYPTIASTAPALDHNAPILQRSGILITRNLIDLRGRSYSVHQLNAIKVDPTAHPSAAGIGCVMAIALFIGGILVVIGVSFLDGHEQRRADSYFTEFVLFLSATAFLAPAFIMWNKIRNLPRWAQLRFEMSSGEVKALDAEWSEVETVAAAIRTAMSQR